MKHIHCHWKI